MTALRHAAAELLGLFVDDGALALCALAWVAVCRWLLPLLSGPGVVAVLLSAGLAGILAFSVLRA